MTSLRPNIFLLTAVLLLCPQTGAFSLLGPLSPWMTDNVGFVSSPSFDVGGPRNLGDEFRWNLPVVTYGFDAEFKRFFGTNGIIAVEEAISILNSLPPASQIDLSRAPQSTVRLHQTAQARWLLDLRTASLAYLIEQLGLASPKRFTFLVSSVNTPTGSEETLGSEPFFIRRNFDPLTVTPTREVNGISFTFKLIQALTNHYPYFPERNRIMEIFAVDQSGDSVSPVAGLVDNPINSRFRPGFYATALSRDDLGGWKYLYATNNVNIEPSSPGVDGAEGPDPEIAIAPRPGRDRIEFVRFDPLSAPITNQFVDIFEINGEFRVQTLKRIVEKPDILFRAGDHPAEFGLFPARVRRTEPNFSHSNENGPGVLFPGVIISFQKLGDIFSDNETIRYERWGSFNSRTTTNLIIYPAGPAYQGARTLSTRIVPVEKQIGFEWRVALIPDVEYSLQVSTNLTQWGPISSFLASGVQTLTNSLSVDGAPTFWKLVRTSGQ